MKLHYEKVGVGQDVVLAFHGIGQTGRSFLTFAQKYASQYTFYLFDLPFHGQSGALAQTKLDVEDWKKWIDFFLKNENITSFSVIGYSMGGKFALITTNEFVGKIEEVWLLAPDGITESKWYLMATRYKFMWRIFSFFVMNVAGRKKIVALFQTLGLVSKSTVRFVESTLATEQQRKQVYDSWIGFSEMGLSMKELSKKIDERKIKLKIFLGQRDAILPIGFIKPLIEKANNCELVILNTGHHKLIQEVLEKCEAIFLKKP